MIFFWNRGSTFVSSSIKCLAFGLALIIFIHSTVVMGSLQPEREGLVIDNKPTSTDVYNITAWQSFSDDNITFPEAGLIRRRTGISFSGGGARAYLAAIGYLAGLRKLNLIKNVDYISGISGGAWATMVYSYSNLEVNDDIFLGMVPEPSSISYEGLSEMDSSCARSFTNIPEPSQPSVSLGKKAFAGWIEAVSEVYFKPCGIERGRPYTWNQNTLDDIKKRNPSLVEANVSFYLPRSARTANHQSLNKKDKEMMDINSNEEIMDVDKRPFPLIAWALLGPTAVAPLKPSNRNYTLVESTPLGTGVLMSRNPYVEYKPFGGISSEAGKEDFMVNDEAAIRDEYDIIGNEATMENLATSSSSSNPTRDSREKTEKLTVGGLVETFMYGTCCAPLSSMPFGSAQASLSIPTTCECPQPDNMSPQPVPGAFMDIATAAGASSYDIGSYAAASSMSFLRNTAGQQFYWSPVSPQPKSVSEQPQPVQNTQSKIQNDVSSASPSVDSFYVADGGALQVDNLASFIQRNLDHIVLSCSTSVSLKPSTVWDPATMPLSETYIDFDIPSFFGVIPEDYSHNRKEYFTYDLSRSQFFATEEWVPLAQSLQAAQAAGRGIIVTHNHTTVENSFYGIPAGRKVSVTWMYLGRLSAWEQQLSPEMQKLVMPSENADDLSNTIDHGPFAGFPNYGTTIASVDFRQANLLADLVGWSVLQNADLFRELLSSD